MAQMTITVPDAQLDRVKEAFGRRSAPEANWTPATPEEVRRAIIAYVIERVRIYEQMAARAAADASVTPVTPT